MLSYDSNRISITKIEHGVIYGYVLRVHLQHKRQFSGAMALLDAMGVAFTIAEEAGLILNELKIIVPLSSTSIRGELAIKRGTISEGKLQQIILRCLKQVFYALGRWGYVISPRPSLELIQEAEVDMTLDDELL